ncbi:MAG: hypothetical protein J6S14_15070 [Clostridia bacterium]|nr:hypothetical protein [Clostridia bacterium]
MKGQERFAAPFLLHMFEIGDIVSVKAEDIGGALYGRNSVGGRFPVNRQYYEIVADLDNGLYVIGIGNLAIAAVRCGDLRLETVSSAWEPVDVSGKVRIRDGAKNYMGYPLPRYVYGKEYTVISVTYDRVLLANEHQTVAIKGEDVL